MTNKLSPPKLRIAKLLALQGVASRRLAEQIIKAGRVKVNGVVVTTPVYFVTADDVVAVDDSMLKRDKPQWRFLLLHKPKQILTSRPPITQKLSGELLGAVKSAGRTSWSGIKGQETRATIYQLLPPEYHQFHYIGRLDYNSEGLIVLTNDGAVKRAWELPKNQLPRYYRARVFGRPNKKTLTRLAQGVNLDGFHYRGMQVTIANHADGKNAKLAPSPSNRHNHWLSIELREGKNREIRKLLEYFGHPVSRLIRVGYGCFHLGDLQKAEWREVVGAEWELAKNLTARILKSG